jgi:hypothetical protein
MSAFTCSLAVRPVSAGAPRKSRSGYRDARRPCESERPQPRVTKMVVSGSSPDTPNQVYQKLS